MGVKNPAADRHAIALGVAMQMTNIARDVREDALRGRSYLPGLLNPFATEAKVVRAEVERLLASAEIQYKIAEVGLRYLPRDCRFAIRMALALYREIGREIKRRDYPVLLGRTVISRPRLVWVLLRTTFSAAGDNLRIASDSLLSRLQGKMMNEPQLNQRSDASDRVHCDHEHCNATALACCLLGCFLDTHYGSGLIRVGLHQSQRRVVLQLAVTVQRIVDGVRVGVQSLGGAM